MIALPIQQRFKLSDPRLRRALVDLQGAANLAGEDNDESDILDDIGRAPADPLRIDWAWDISGRGAGDRINRMNKISSAPNSVPNSVNSVNSVKAPKREIRVLALCVQNRTARFSFEDVLYTIFPEQRTKLFRKPTLTATFIARRFACTATHVLNLIADGELEFVPNTKRAGRSGSPAIYWESVREFLEGRRI